MELPLWATIVALALTGAESVGASSFLRSQPLLWIATRGANSSLISEAAITMFGGRVSVAAVGGPVAIIPAKPPSPTPKP